MKRIVILGAGFGGLRAALRLAKKLGALEREEQYRIILIDQNDHHTYTPLLYEVATTSKETADLSKLHEISTYKVQAIVEGLPILFLQAEVERLDVVHSHLHLKDGRKLSYDYLVIAVGSETNFFGIPGLKEYAVPLKSFRDAIRIRDAVWNLREEKQSEIKIVIGGGGSTGVELAAELKVWCGQLEKDYPKCRLSVTIVQGPKVILPGLDSRVREKVERRLESLSVTMKRGERISKVEKNQVILTNGERIPFDLLLWAGGTRGMGIVSELPLKCEERGRIEVLGPLECLPQDPHLRLHSKVYALGDAVCFYDPRTKKPVSGVARAAISQANVVAHNILEDIKAEEKLTLKPSYKIYRPIEYPYIIPVGGKYAVAKIGPFVIKGLLGWILKGLVELNYLVSIMPLAKALRIWLTGLKIFIQNDRLG